MWRKMALAAKPDVIISESEGNWTLITKSTFKTTELKFRLREEFKETRGDGREILVSPWLNSSNNSGCIRR